MMSSGVLSKSVLAITLSLIIQFSAFSKSRSINQLRDKISNQSSKVSKLAGKIRSLEKNIVLKNENYLERVRVIEGLENKIRVVRQSLAQQRSDLDQSYLIVSDSIERYLLEVEDDESDESLEKRSLYLNVLEAKRLELSKGLKESNNLERKVDSYEKRILSQKRSERILYDLIINLENKKKSLSQNYISELERKNNNQEKLDKKLAKAKAYKKTYKKRVKNRIKRKIKKEKPQFLMSLILPAENIVDIKKGKAGIYLKYKESLPVKAPMSGQIEYAGELASYGNVLMINHGKDVRSVLMGDIKIKLKKGDFVKKNQVLGYTVSDTGVKKSLYYEVRKKNIAQNTIKWIAKDKTGRIKL